MEKPILSNYKVLLSRTTTENCYNYKLYSNDLIEYINYLEMKTKTLRFEEELLKKAEIKAKQTHSSFNSWLVYLVKKELNLIKK